MTRQSGQSAFADLAVAPPDAVFLVSAKFREDASPKKVNMGVGAYRTDEGKPWVLPVVRKVEERMATDTSIDHEYLPIDGLASYTSAMATLAFGKESQALAEKRVVSCQSLSGTGGLRVVGEFLARFYPQSKTILLPAPTWENHHVLFRNAGLTVQEYRYYKPDTRGLDVDGMLEDIKAAPEHSILLLHQCAHNPTGVDPTQDQWRAIADAVEERSLLTFFDSAYQGFVSGNPEVDGWAARYFESRGIEFLLVQSCAKNFGLYNERVGCIQAVLRTKEAADAVRSQLKAIVRPMYSNPPLHGAFVVSAILNDPALYQEWIQQLGTMSSRILSMREALYQALKAKGTPGTWEHIINQKGMFTYTGLTSPQVERLTNDFHIYLLKSGRINMCGLNPGNVEYVASAIHSVVTGQ